MGLSDNPDPPAEHGFADDYVLRGVEQGWFSFDNGRVETEFHRMPDVQAAERRWSWTGEGEVVSVVQFLTVAAAFFAVGVNVGRWLYGKAE